MTRGTKPTPNMENNDTEFIDSQDDAETTENQTEGETTPAEDVEELKKKLATAEAQKDHWRKKATEGKEVKTPVDSTPQEQSLTVKDTLAFIENKISIEDYDEVIRVSKILGKPVSESLKDQTLKTILANRVEERQTAEMTQTKGGQRGVVKITGDALLDKAESTGEVPDSVEDMQKIFIARRARKTGK